MIITNVYCGFIFIRRLIKDKHFSSSLAWPPWITGESPVIHGGNLPSDRGGIAPAEFWLRGRSLSQSWRLWAGAPKSVTDKLQQVVNAAVQVVSGTKKYDDGLTHLFTLSCIGSMWQIESRTSLGWRCTSAWMARHQILCLSCVHRSLKLLNDSIFIPPAAVYSLLHGFSSIRTALAPLLSLDQRHGTYSRTISVSRTCKLTVFVVHWRRFFISTRHIERIRCNFATMRYINWH